MLTRDLGFCNSTTLLRTYAQYVQLMMDDRLGMRNAVNLIFVLNGAIPFGCKGHAPYTHRCGEGYPSTSGSYVVVEISTSTAGLWLVISPA